MRTAEDDKAVSEYRERVQHAADLLEQLHTEVGSLLSKPNVRSAEGHYRDCRRYENVLDEACELLDARRYSDLPDGIRGLIMERDKARFDEMRAERRAAEAESCCGCDSGGEHALPEPEKTNPQHWDFAAALIERSGLPGAWTVGQLRSQAQGLTKERADNVVDVVEVAITAYFFTVYGTSPKVNPNFLQGVEAAVRAAREAGGA